MSIWTILWLVWLAYFVLVEGYALYLNTSKKEGEAKSGRTLSAHGWAWFGTAPGTKPTAWAWVRRVALSLFCLWFAVHFIFGGTIV